MENNTCKAGLNEDNFFESFGEDKLKACNGCDFLDYDSDDGIVTCKKFARKED